MFESDLDLDENRTFEPDISAKPDISISLDFSKEKSRKLLESTGYFKTEPEFPVLHSRAHIDITVLAITFAYFVGLR